MPDQPLYRDPWAKREAWRKHPIFSTRARFRNIFPGFGIAVVAFAAYVAYDETVGAAKKGHGTEHH
ncbi:NADH:ubiquinone oxidoreductase, B12 subunit [Rhodotorula toruloides NP11]|uniref:NADH:ubiquinone oxidoreductase, B12 subunit n=1 Tax=Rhodotorula toruloides (strain NP11) TaxID=1130832 RepID=M7XVN7_RHOT1|nr:NADH:ubiquinone oxidoreductase, B12 subunit [Rhodotorula toruloides NP11]EMS24288.1 NADH:ubiquinone oxidoreductase, B12 subunit [Rhodotorula toruloides NP11]